MHEEDYFFGIRRTPVGSGGTITTINFENCYSTSNESNGSWVSSTFVTAQELNNAFVSFEEKMLNEIKTKVLSLNLVSETVRPTESATAGLDLFQRKTGCVGTLSSAAQKHTVGKSTDAAEIKTIIEKY